MGFVVNIFSELQNVMELKKVKNFATFQQSIKVTKYFKNKKTFFEHLKISREKND